MACEGNIEPEKLPPTDRAEFFHALRVHLLARMLVKVKHTCEVLCDKR